MGALNLTDLQLVEDQPRVLDLKIAERLGFDRPRDIRKLVDRNLARLSRRGEVCAVMAQTSDVGGRPGTEYWLTKWQAIKICMWSDAPNADAVQDEIADVFDAYTDGKLVPPGRAPVTTDVLRQIFDPIRETVEHTRHVVEGTAGNVVSLMSAAVRMERRMNDVIPRKEASEKNKQIYRHTIAKRCEKLCPCGCRQRILDDNGNVLLDEAGQPIAVYDHWYSRERNGLEAMWLVHRDCNEKLKDDDYRRSKHSRFVVFHEERKAVQSDFFTPIRSRKRPSKICHRPGQYNLFGD